MSNLAYIDDTKIWTYKDVQKLDDDNRYEIINGKLHMLASPTTIHQIISRELSVQISKYFDGKPCEPFYAPLDVDIENKGKDAVKLLQPDIFVICDKSKIKEKIHGAPDFVIEILSPGSTKRDTEEKFKTYERYKVKEYWIVDPTKKEIQLYLLRKNKYEDKGMYSFKDQIKSNIFFGLEINLKELYDYKKLFVYEESEEYNKEEKRLERTIWKYVDYDLGKYEKQILQYILDLKDMWNYEDDVMQLGAFRKLFELMDGELVYRGHNIINFK